MVIWHLLEIYDNSTVIVNRRPQAFTQISFCPLEVAYHAIFIMKFLFYVFIKYCTFQHSIKEKKGYPLKPAVLQFCSYE